MSDDPLLTLPTFLATIAPAWESNELPYILGKSLLSFLACDPSSRYRPGLRPGAPWTALVRIIEHVYALTSPPPPDISRLARRAQAAAFTLTLVVCGHPPPQATYDSETYELVIGGGAARNLRPQNETWGLRPAAYSHETLERILLDLAEDAPGWMRFEREGGVSPEPEPKSEPASPDSHAPAPATPSGGPPLAPPPYRPTDTDVVRSGDSRGGQERIQPPSAYNPVVPEPDRQAANAGRPSRSYEAERTIAREQNSHDEALLAIRAKQLQSELEGVRRAQEMNARERTWLKRNAELEEMVEVLRKRPRAE